MTFVYPPLEKDNQGKIDITPLLVLIHPESETTTEGNFDDSSVPK